MKTLSRVAAVASGLALTAAATVGLATSASAYSTTPNGPLSWTPDGPVHAVLNAGGVTYVGGAFTGGVAEINSSTGAVVWNGNANGDVRALALSSDGSHLIIGGAFTTVAGATHKKLASLGASSGAVVPTWKAAAGGTVRDIVVSGSTAYFGGIFTRQNGVVQGGLGAVNVDTGKVVPAFNASTNRSVFGLAVSGSRLYIAGNYTAVNGSNRNSLSSWNLATNSLDEWNPARTCSGCDQYWDVAVDANTAYVGSSGPGGRLGAYDITSGASRFRTIAADGDVQALTISGGLVYAGGHFATIAGQPRKILAAVNESTGALAPFSANFVTSYPGIWALDARSSTLYVGGNFTAAGPTPPKRFPYLAFFPM